MNRKWFIFKILSLICTLIFQLRLEHYACLGSSGYQDLFGKKNHGYLISAQSYDFCPRLIQLDILDFTLSHMCCAGTFCARSQYASNCFSGPILPSYNHVKVILYVLRFFLTSFFLELLNPWQKVLERSGLRFENFY